MKHVKTVFSILAFLTIAFLGYQVIENSKQNQVLKKDAAEMNHFKYGLFSVDAWKQQLSGIITNEIDKLYLTRKNEKALKNHLESQLEILIDKINERIKTQNEKTANGRLKQSIMESFIDIEDIKKGVPDYAKAIMAEMSSQKTESQIKGMLKDKIDMYMKDTFDTLPDTNKDEIIKRYKAQNEDDAKLIIANTITQKHHVITEQVLIMIILAVIIFIIEGLNTKPLPQPQYITLTLTLIALLAVGVTIPMIDMEAKISHLSFILFDHPIEFKDQVLFFQSKSILDVFNIMILHKDIQMKLVGILMVCFSIVFPVLKMMSSLAFYYNYFKARQYRVIQWFVLKSGKWSMADVVVIAIFMAYIGFNGIINSQLDNMRASSDNLEMLTTNGTNLQPGFYLFFAYAILAMFLSGYLDKRPYQCKTEE